MASDLRLVEVPAFKRELLIQKEDTAKDALLRSLLDRATGQIEQYVGRKLIYRETAYVEFHTLEEHRTKIFLNESPVLASPVIVVREDSSGAHTDASLDLAKGVDYVVSVQRGMLRRVSARVAPVWWDVGVRTIRVTYAGGYDDLDNEKVNIPAALQDVCVRMAAAAYREVSEKLHGIQVRTDVAGSEIRGLAPRARVHLSDDMKVQLDPFVWSAGIQTGEQD